MEFFYTSIFFGAGLTLSVYIFGNTLKNKYKKAIFNPILISVIIIIAFLLLFKIDYDTYYSGAQYLNFLLTPATVCLAVPLYRQINLLKQNLKAILLAIVAGVLASGIGIFALAIIFKLNTSQYATLLPKSITTAIGMGLSQELGGIATITVATIVMTGIFGNISAPWVIKTFKIHNPVAQGLAIGTASHAIGTSKALELGEVQGAMSSLSIAVAGILTVIVAQFFINLI